MARIRSIKPEFWSDEKIAALPKATALFFISLWNFADDQGIVEANPRALALRIPIYRSQDITKMLNALWKAGLIKRSRGDEQAMGSRSQGDEQALEQRWACDGLVLINGWRHQKIDKPRDGKWKHNEIKWLTWTDSTNGREESPNVRRKDRIGSDRIGEDRIWVAALASGETHPPSKAPPPKERTEAKSGRAWEAYSEAFQQRWNTEPKRNAKVNRQLCSLVDRLGADEAPNVLRFYLQHNKAYYVERMHPVGACLADAEKLYAEWSSGRQITSTEARAVDRRQTNFSAWAPLLAEAEKHEKEIRDAS